MDHSKKDVSFVARMAVLLLAANSVATTRAWTSSTTSTTTSTRTSNGDRSRSSSTSCARMTNGSYEEQFAAFAKQQQDQQQQMQQQMQQEEEQQVPQQPNTIRSDATAIPPFEKNPNRKAQEELEMAFLEFISCSPTKNGIPAFQPPSPQEPQNPEYEMYTDVSTSLDFATFPQHTANDAIAIDGEFELELESVVSASDSLSTEPTGITTTSSPEDNVAAAASSTSHLDNLGSENTSGSVGDTTSSNSDSGVESDGDVDVDAPKSASTDNSEEDDNFYTIEVRVETTFPTGVTVEDAKLGWLEFCWARGGGIVVPAAPLDKSPLAASKPNSTQAVDAPATIRFGSIDEDATNNNKDEETQELLESRFDITGIPIPARIPSSRDLIVPLGLKQKLVSSTSTLDEIQTATIRRDVVTYKTTETGFFCRDMIQDTHEGRVEFIGAPYTSTRMIWTVTFQVEEDEESTAAATKQSMPTTITKNREDTTANDVLEFASTTKNIVEGYSKQFMDSNPELKTMLSKGNLWGSWSQFQLKTASQNLIAYLDNSEDSMPVLEHTETLPIGVSPREAMEAWYDYYWKNGGGAKLVRSSSEEGRDTRWLLPSGLKEELVSLEYDRPVSESGVDGRITTETEIAKAVYKVNNPNLLTYPAHYNRATVRFVREGETNPTQLFWEVKVKPYRKFLGGGMLFSTKNGIALASRNLRNYLELQQLKKKEADLQALLDVLKKKNPSSSSDSTTTANSNNDTNDDQLPLEGVKTIRSTVSISSVQVTDSVEHDEISTNINNSGNDDDNDIDKNDTENNPMVNDNAQQPLQLDQVDVKKPTTFASPRRFVDQNKKRPTIKTLHEEGRRTLPLFPPRTIDDRATIEIDTSTHDVKRP